jgi:hypothetical protein
MTHRYRVREIRKEGSDTRYILVDERGQFQRQGFLDYDEHGHFERFEKTTFATPEEAWASIKDVPCLPPDTPLYKYTFYAKGGGFSFEYISEQRVVDKLAVDQWVGLKTTDDEHVSICLDELLRFVVKEV